MIKQRTRILLCLDDRLHMNQVATGIERETQFPREGLAFQPIPLFLHDFNTSIFRMGVGIATVLLVQLRAGEIDGAAGVAYDSGTGRVLVACGVADALAVVDVSDPSSPTLVGEVADPRRLNGAAGVAFDAVAGEGNRTRIFVTRDGG